MSPRLRHHVLLLLLGAVLFLPRLGTPSLWDIDEGNNAEAAREMLESGNWVVPTFNFELRVDKPALLYWLQIAAYQLFGVNEFAARLPSALAAILTMLLAYELARALFGDARQGLLAGVILGSSLLVAGAARFANPDALLHATTVLTMLGIWQSVGLGRRPYWLLTGAGMGLAVLAKGPVGIVLPGLVAFLFILFTRRWRMLNPRWMALSTLVVLLIALPWYVWVGVETKAAFLKGFFFTHNVGRYLQPMERHGGPVYYYLVVLLLGFAPWSVLLGPTVAASIAEQRRAGPSSGERLLSSAHVFLWCWFATYVVFFSLGQTKLPNYILPAYAPLAVLTARYLERWRLGDLQTRSWIWHAGMASLVLLGTGLAAGALVASGSLGESLVRGRTLPGVGVWAALGLIPLLGAVAGWVALVRGNRGGLVAALAVTAVLLTSLLGAGGAASLEDRKAPRTLVNQHELCQPENEIRLAAFRYFQPSLVFYCQREVQRIEDEALAAQFLDSALPVYLFVPEAAWASLQTRVEPNCRVLGRQRDLYRGYDVLVISNR